MKKDINIYRWHGEFRNCTDIFKMMKTDDGFCCSFNTIGVEDSFAKVDDNDDADDSNDYDYYDDYDYMYDYNDDDATTGNGATTDTTESSDTADSNQGKLSENWQVQH